MYMVTVKNGFCESVLFILIEYTNDEKYYIQYVDL